LWYESTIIKLLPSQEDIVAPPGSSHNPAMPYETYLDPIVFIIIVRNCLK